MTDLNETQLRRLPNYARVHLERLARRVEELEARLGEGPDDSTVYLSNGYGVTPTPLGADPQVSFYRNAAEAAEDITWGRIDVRGVERDDRRWLQIMGTRGLLLVPQVTNVIHITQEGW